MFNPWLVEGIEAFSFYCCPECTFRSNEPNFFQIHALKNHALSKSLFDNDLEEIKVDIKVEHIEVEPDTPYDDSEKSEKEYKLNLSDYLKEEHGLSGDALYADSESNIDINEGLHNEIQVFCDTCQTSVSKKSFQRHLRSKFHKGNAENSKDQLVENEMILSKTEETSINLKVNCKICNKTLSKKYLSEHIKLTHNNEAKRDKKLSKNSDFCEDQEIWNMEIFCKMNEKQVDVYKQNWGNFCKISYHDQKNPPTEEMFVDYITKKKEAGRSDKALWNIYLTLKKVTFHVHGQKIQNFTKLKELLVYSTKEYNPVGPKIPKPGSAVDDSGVCPHCGEVSIFKILIEANHS